MKRITTLLNLAITGLLFKKRQRPPMTGVVSRVNSYDSPADSSLMFQSLRFQANLPASLGP
jgi:hypothetical protein